MRRQIVAGNWKMNKTFAEGTQLIEDILELKQGLLLDCKLIVAPPFILLDKANELLEDSGIALAAQNCHQDERGAHTGEISAEMLHSVGVGYVILGHSERRQNYNESDHVVSLKMEAAFEKDMKVIWCCGEPLEIRQVHDEEKYVGKQLEASILNLTPEQLSQVIIAYEPIWAIGTGHTASAAQAQAMHRFIRTKLAEAFGEEVAQTVTILYGGSCKPGNAQELFSMPDVDGGLIGGASLNAADFLAIAQSFQ